MTTKKIANLLDQAGYQVSLLRDSFIIAGVKSTEPIDSITGIAVLSSAFNITIKDTDMILEYPDHQVSIQKHYDDLDKMIQFIKLTFPF